MEENEKRIVIGEVGKEEFREMTRGAEAGVRLKLIDRSQGRYEVVVVEELIPEDHLARAIWEMAGELDLSGYMGKIRAVKGVAGREKTDPRLLLSLWLYSYTQSVGSAREIERLCGYQPAYRWLCGLEVVNYHTLSSFRVDHKEELERLFVEQLGILNREGFVDLEEVMHDGTKIQAQAGGGTFRREKTLEEHMELAEKLVTELSEGNQGEELSKRRQSAQKRARREKLERLKKAQEELKKVRAIKGTAKEKENARVSETDPEARIMKQSGSGGFAPSYNVQVTTDAKAKIILAVEATQSGTDAHELMPAVARVEENLGAKPVQMVADGGFTSRENIQAMAAQDVVFIGSLADRTKQIEASYERLGIPREFWREAFKYDEASDSYTCPNAEVLIHKGETKVAGGVEHRYSTDPAVCDACPFKKQCCPKGRRREIIRVAETIEMIEYRKKMESEEAKATYKRRSEVAEFPNLWIKEKLGLRRFHLRGLVKVGIESTWVCLTYNIQQWVRLSWRPKLKAAAVII